MQLSVGFLKIVKLWLILVFALGANLSFAQLPGFQSLDEPIIANPSALCTSANGDVYVLQYKKGIGYMSGTIYVQKWNGQFWVTFPSVPVEELDVSQENKMDIVIHQDELYIAGSFILKNHTGGGVLKWNGKNWEVAGGGLWSDYFVQGAISIESMQSVGTRLYVAGNFNLAGKDVVKNFVYLENNIWNKINTDNGNVGSLIVLGDTVYAGGNFQYIEGQSTGNFAAFYGGKWNALANTGQAIKGLAVYLNQPIIMERNKVFHFTNQSLNSIHNGWDFEVEVFNDWVESAGKLYCSGTFKAKNNTIYHMLIWDGIVWKALFPDNSIEPSQNVQYFITGSEKAMYMAGLFNKVGNFPIQRILKFQPSYSVIKGKVYHDLNQNCTQDAGESTMPNVVISLNGGNYYTSTNAKGEFELSVAMGRDHTISVFPNENFSQGCKSTELTMYIGNKDSIYGLEFPLIETPAVDKDEVRISSSSGFVARHGYKTQYKITCHATDWQQKKHLTLHYPKGMILTNSDRPYLYDNGSNISWDLKGDTFIGLEFLIDPMQFSAGDTLQFTAELSLVNSNQFNARSQFTQRVVAAFDPNDKQCNKTVIDKNENSLEYRIRFQNLGTDSAVTVNVVDTISPSLPMQYIKVLQTSHSKQYQLNYKIRDHAIIWNFTNIYLPPKSTSGDDTSSGFIDFKAGLTKGLKVGDTIKNQAFIYFDYQKPVATNVASTNIVNSVIKKDELPDFKVWPNPIIQTLYLENDPYLMKSVKVFNLSGQLIFKKDMELPVSKLLFDLPKIHSGIYILEVDFTSGVKTKKISVLND